MISKSLLLALAASPFVAAHGKVAVVTGDQGGNTTGLGILGGVVPGPGPNRKTEVDTTVFRSTNIKTDGLGRTNKNGKNTVDMIDIAMAQSGNMLPQVSDGGHIEGTFHIVTTDGAGPLQAVLDPTATGAFSQGVMLEAATQVPGRGGNIRAPRNAKRSLFERAWDALATTGVIQKRAANVNQDYPVKFTVPAGTKCTGTVKDMQNVCLVKIANNNAAGPFGGVVAIQMAGTSGSSGIASAGSPAGAGDAPAKAANAKPSRAKSPAARRAMDAPEPEHSCPTTAENGESLDHECAPPARRSVQWSA